MSKYDKIHNALRLVKFNDGEVALLSPKAIADLGEQFTRGELLSPERAGRIVQACEGIPDPADLIKRLVEAVEELSRTSCTCSVCVKARAALALVPERLRGGQ